MITTVDIITILAYFALLLGVGFVFNRLNSNADDYFRGGCKGTWWMVGMSTFMGSFSAWTFTGAAGAGFSAGWSILIIFWAVATGCFVAVWVAPWFRQMRVYAMPQVFEQRWHKPLARLQFYIFAVFAAIAPAIWLYGLATFASAMFGLNLELLILILGVVVLVYSMVGGTWGGLATDFLQGVILIPITLLIAVLCLIEVGGISGLLGLIEQQGLAAEYAMIKPDGGSGDGRYTFWWAAAMVVIQINTSVNMGNALKYNSVKDGKSARYAALFAGLLMAVGAFVWFVPPVTARLLYADQVNLALIANPAESAYAVAALNVLPAGLKGLLVVSIFAATLSSMDSGLTRQSANYFNVFIPDFCGLFKIQPPRSDRAQLLIGRIITLILGVVIIALALTFARKGRGVFELLLQLQNFLVGVGIISLWGLFIRRAPLITPYACMLSGLIAGVLTLWSEPLLGLKLNFQQQLLVNFGIPSVAYFLCVPFFTRSSPAFKARVDAFFTKMKTPIDFEREVGAPADVTQFILVGRFSAVIAVFVLVLSFTASSSRDLISILAVACVIGLLGGLLWFAGARSKSRLVRFKQSLEAHGEHAALQK